MMTTLDELRSKVIFQNSIDVWITLCKENNTTWNNATNYQKFISFLQDNDVTLKSFTLCAHDAGSAEKEKNDFAEELKSINDSKSKTYTIKLDDKTLNLIRGFKLD